MKNIRIIGGELIKLLTLQELRMLRGVQQQALAARLGVAGSVVSRYESTENPSYGTLRSYVQALGGELLLVAAIDTPLGVEKHLIRMPGTVSGMVRETAQGSAEPATSLRKFAALVD